jgi:hypothetical protein
VASPETAWPGKGDRVKVLSALDPHAGQVGIVRRVELDGGELLLTVEFHDGGTAEYWADEVLMRP